MERRPYDQEDEGEPTGEHDPAELAELLEAEGLDEDEDTG